MQTLLVKFKIMLYTYKLTKPGGRKATPFSDSCQKYVREDSIFLALKIFAFGLWGLQGCTNSTILYVSQVTVDPSLISSCVLYEADNQITINLPVSVSQGSRHIFFFCQDPERKKPAFPGHQGTGYGIQYGSDIDMGRVWVIREQF